jgi:hypothetical protein
MTRPLPSLVTILWTTLFSRNILGLQTVITPGKLRSRDGKCLSAEIRLLDIESGGGREEREVRRDVQRGEIIDQQAKPYLGLCCILVGCQALGFRPY